MAGKRGFRAYRGGINRDFKHDGIGFWGYGDKPFGKPTPKGYFTKNYPMPQSEAHTIQAPDPEKVALLKTEKDETASRAADLEVYRRYRDRWAAGDKKIPLVPFQKWRELRNRES